MLTRWRPPKPAPDAPQHGQAQVEDHERAHEVTHKHRQDVKHDLRVTQAIEYAHTQERVITRRHHRQHRQVHGVEWG